MPYTTAPTLQWSDALNLDMPLMDSTHQEFVDLLAAVVTAPDSDLLERWSTLIAHTDQHFGLEDQWMLQTGFARANCHSTQHKIILQVMREGEQRGKNGELDVVRQMARELGAWFPQHAQAMDASLALHLRSAGFDPVTGTVAQPDRLPAEAIHGCGGSTCSEPSPIPDPHPQTAEA